MTTSAPESTESPPAVPAAPADPHASKIAPDDPRLRVRATRGRTLKPGPAIALVVGIVGLLLVCLLAAILPSSRGADARKTGESPTTSPPAAVIPETIRGQQQPGPGGHPPPPTDRLSVVPLPDAGIPDFSGYRTSADRPFRDERAEQDLRARGASILFDAPRGAASSPPPAASPPLAMPPSEPPRLPSAGADGDPNMQERKNTFLDPQGTGRHATYLNERVQHPRSPFEVKAGTIIPAVLITAINSDLPGPVIGQVRENVYDTVSGNHLLIPQGARLIAQYDSMVAWGQERVLVCWQRLIFPNGDSLSLDCMPAADLAGAAGLADGVDEHWARIIKGAAVASLLAATSEAAAGNTQGYQPTIAQSWARGAAGQVSQTGQQITGRNINVQPTITIRPGFAVNVIVSKDLVLPGPYSESKSTPTPWSAP